jgi:hypothetical protein
MAATEGAQLKADVRLPLSAFSSSATRDGNAGASASPRSHPQGSLSPKSGRALHLLNPK